MALISYKIVDGSKYYLLQNCYKSFIEVDERYLIRSSATVYFVKSFKNGNLPELKDKSINIEGLDSPDGYFNEM